MNIQIIKLYDINSNINSICFEENNFYIACDKKILIFENLTFSYQFDFIQVSEQKIKNILNISNRILICNENCLYIYEKEINEITFW